MVEKVWDEFASGAAKELLDLHGGILELAVVIARALALLIVPVCDGVQRRILGGPRADPPGTRDAGYRLTGAPSPLRDRAG